MLLYPGSCATADEATYYLTEVVGKQFQLWCDYGQANKGGMLSLLASKVSIYWFYCVNIDFKQVSI
jgi:hypothetical protein